MAGWFSETSDEQRKRLLEERRAAEREARQKRRAEKRRAEKAAFQKEIDKEVEKQMEFLSPDKKKERLDRMHGSSCLLNGALGQEFSYKGTMTPTPWMKSPGLQQGIGRAKVQKGDEADKPEPEKKEATLPAFNVPRLTRPF